jgi:hypothetical protein
MIDDLAMRDVTLDLRIELSYTLLNRQGRAPCSAYPE